MSVGCGRGVAASRRSVAACASSPWYSIEYGTAVKPWGRCRIVVKKPVADAFASPVRPSSHFWTSILGRSGRIEVGGFGFGGHAGNERLVVIESRPRTFVDQEVMQAGLGGSPFRSGRPSHDVTTQLLQQGVVTGPDLPQEEAVHDPRRLDQLSERLPLAVGELREVGADVRRHEARGHRAQLGRRWSGRLLVARGRLR